MTESQSYSPVSAATGAGPLFSLIGWTTDGARDARQLAPAADKPSHTTHAAVCQCTNSDIGPDYSITSSARASSVECTPIGKSATACDFPLSGRGSVQSDI
jgi:hypothetical protein